MDISVLVGKKISGSEFNNIFHGIKFIKLTNRNENHNGFQFKDGLNNDDQYRKKYHPLDGDGICFSRYIHFTEEQKAGRWICYNYSPMTYMREVIVPDDAIIYVDFDKFEADKLILGPKKFINKYIYLQGIKLNNKILGLLEPKHMENIETYKQISLELVKEHPYLLKWVSECVKDIEFYNNAFSNNINVFTYIPNVFKHRDMCLKAVQYDANLLHCIPDHLRDKEIYAEGIKKDIRLLLSVPSDLLPEILKDTQKS